MEPLHVLIAHNDSASAASLAAALRPAVRSVQVAASAADLRRVIARSRPDLAVIDLEAVPLPLVRELHREFPQLAVVCTHRLPDERMWTEALESGAIDCCQSCDAEGILLAARRNLHSATRSTAA